MSNHLLINLFILLTHCLSSEELTPTPPTNVQPLPADYTSSGEQLLIGASYEGTYQSQQSENLFEYLDSKSGTIDVIFFNDPLKVDIDSRLNTIIIVLFDPVYHDRKAVRMLLSVSNFTNGSWIANGSLVEVTKFWKERSNDDENVNTTYQITVNNFQPDAKAKQLSLQLNITGPKFSFTAHLDYEDETLSTMGYCLYVTAVVMGQALAAFFLLKQIDGPNPNISNKLSLATIAFCNIQDFYFTMIHIEYIMESTSNAFLMYILPATAYILLFVVFDMKLLFLVWRSHYMRQIENPQELRKKLTTFYIKFYVGLFIYLTLTYFFNYEEWLILLQGLLFLPQIVHNVRVGTNPGFQPLYLFGFLALRFMIPLYERACPGNHFQLAPVYWLVVVLAIFYAVQILILVGQSIFGARFFVPRFLQPDYYNYNHKLRRTPENEDLQCSICLQSIFNDQNLLNSSELERSMLEEKTIMRTPCNHFFHRECLLNWIDVKLECPSCRAVLPPI